MSVEDWTRGEQRVRLYGKSDYGLEKKEERGDAGGVKGFKYECRTRRIKTVYAYLSPATIFGRVSSMENACLDGRYAELAVEVCGLRQKLERSLCGS